MVEEVLAEALHEVTANPVTFIIELVQFGVLMFVVKAVGFGMGARKGMFTNMLAERQERIRSSLQDAASADEELGAAYAYAAEKVARARSEARELVASARKSAEEDAARVTAAVEDELAEIRALADQTLAKERTEMLGGVQEQLVDLVTLATRQILDEGYTPSEQRALIQKSVLESLDDLESISLH